MESYSISDVIRLLGLPPAPAGRLSYYIPCPCCDSGRDRHMNINLQKDVFRCPRCGEAGGIFDLYSLYTGTPRAQVKAALAEKLGAGFHSSYVPPELEDCPLTDVATRHTTYSALLNLLTLSQDHRENLLSRGLSEEEISRLRYRTTPVMGHAAIAKQLQDQGCYLAGVPGFFRTEDGNWALTGLPRGILIPVRNVCGQIQGLQLRKDNSVKRKFRWVSSMGEKDGCGAECWTHLAGAATDTLILTEGPMKADVIHALTGLSVLAVPGVNGLSQLSETLLDLQHNHGLDSIKTAFDMDYTSNYHVQTGYAALYALLDKLDLTYSTYLWDPRYKGLADYIWESLLHKQRAN